MVPKSTWSVVRVAAFASICVLGRPAGAAEQSPDRVRLSLFEGAPRAESSACTLEVVVNASAGEAILSCERNTSPVSRLGAHRALTTSEVARLYALASVPAAPPQGSGSDARSSADGSMSTLTIQQGDQRVVLDLGPGQQSILSERDRQTVRMLRQLVDELRGSGRHE